MVIRLDGHNLELAATTAYLGGRVSDAMEGLQRAQQYHARQGDHRRAARCAFWLGFMLLDRGELAQGSGWLARARRLLEHEPPDCAEQGYLLLPARHRPTRVADDPGGTSPGLHHPLARAR